MQYAMVVGLIGVVALVAINGVGLSNRLLLTRVANALGNSGGSASGEAAAEAVPAGLTLAATALSVAEGNSGTTPLVFTARIPAPLGANLVFSHAVSAGTAIAGDFVGGTLPSGTATIPAGATSVPIAVNIAGDTLFEQDESFTLTLTGIVSGPSTLGTPASATGTILNDDAASGAFVMSAAIFNGNFGGLAGANATCLSEVTNSGWLNKDNYELTAANVKAFLCDKTTCNTLAPDRTYTVAYSGNPGRGGATFTTDSAGVGPNDSASWSGSTYFGATLTSWMNYSTTNTTQWSYTPAATTDAQTCVNWTSSSVGNTGGIGTSNSNSSSRWSSSSSNCNAGRHLMCIVN